MNIFLLILATCSNLKVSQSLGVKSIQLDFKRDFWQLLFIVAKTSYFISL